MTMPALDKIEMRKVLTFWSLNDKETAWNNSVSLNTEKGFWLIIFIVFRSKVKCNKYGLIYIATISLI